MQARHTQGERQDRQTREPPENLLLLCRLADEKLKEELKDISQIAHSLF